MTLTDSKSILQKLSHFCVAYMIKLKFIIVKGEGVDGMGVSRLLVRETGQRSFWNMCVIESAMPQIPIG